MLAPHGREGGNGKEGGREGPARTHVRRFRAKMGSKKEKRWAAKESSLAPLIKNQVHRPNACDPPDLVRFIRKREPADERLAGVGLAPTCMAYEARLELSPANPRYGSEQVRRPMVAAPAGAAGMEMVCRGTSAISRTACDGHAGWSRTTCRQGCGLLRPRDGGWLRRDE
jgi:hypothetical protein